MPLNVLCPNCGALYSKLTRSVEAYREWQEKHPRPFALCCVCWNKAGCPDDDTKWPDGVAGGALKRPESFDRGIIDELFIAIEKRLSPNEFSCKRSETWIGVPFLFLDINGHHFRMIPSEENALEFWHYFTCGACLHRLPKHPVTRLDRKFDIREASVVEQIVAYISLVKACDNWEDDPSSLTPA